MEPIKKGDLLCHVLIWGLQRNCLSRYDPLLRYVLAAKVDAVLVLAFFFCIIVASRPSLNRLLDLLRVAV